MFLYHHQTLRPSCYECKFCTTERQGDISLGDFWGIGKYNHEFDDDKGTSLVIINTRKGQDAFRKIESELNYCESDIETAIKGNKVLIEPSKKNENREEFYKMYEDKGLSIAINTYINIPSKPVQVYYNIRRTLLDIYRLLFNKKW